MCVPLSCVCAMVSSKDPASEWGPSEFVRLQGVELRLTEIESPVNKNLSDSASLLVNLRSSERLQRCMYVLKKYAQVGPVVGIPVK